MHFEFETAPGFYCLTEDLHARIEMADRPVESSLIKIYSSNVVLDLQGHTLGRGWLFKNPGGTGISIGYSIDPERYINIVIKNGTLQDFYAGIGAGKLEDKVEDTPTFDEKSNTYHFPANNITLENITFKNNKRNFFVRATGSGKKPPSASKPDKQERP